MNLRPFPPVDALDRILLTFHELREHTAVSVCVYVCCSALPHLCVSDFQHVYMLAVILVTEKPPVAVFPHLALDLSPTVRVKIAPCCAQTALCAPGLRRNLEDVGAATHRKWFYCQSSYCRYFLSWLT